MNEALSFIRPTGHLHVMNALYVICVVNDIIQYYEYISYCNLYCKLRLVCC